MHKRTSLGNRCKHLVNESVCTHNDNRYPAIENSCGHDYCPLKGTFGEVCSNCGRCVERLHHHLCKKCSQVVGRERITSLLEQTYLLPLSSSNCLSLEEVM